MTMKFAMNFSEIFILFPLVIVKAPSKSKRASSSQVNQSDHQVAESFSLSYDGRTAKVGKEDIIIDEAAIAEYTGLPRTGDCWFKTTTPSNNEFRSYLISMHKDLT
jgi:hypothetical protein